MSDKKEAFIRNRLAEMPLFGQPDVEEWLAREREADRPHIPKEPTVPLVSQWQRLPGSDLLRLTDQRVAYGQLVNNATHVGDFGIEKVSPKLGDWWPFAELLGTHVEGARIYVGYWAFVVLALGRYLYILRVLRGIERGAEDEGIVSYPFASSTDRMSRAVADVLLGEWARGRRKAREAREVLCNAVEHRVHEERVKAERDFNAAVAMSEDGTKIVSADYVVIVDRKTDDGDPLFRAYFTAPFQQHKLRKPTFIDRLTTGGRGHFHSGSGLHDAAAVARKLFVMGDPSVRDPMCGRARIITYICEGDRQVRIYVAGESSVSADLRGNLGSGAVCFL